ncbi:MAG TPA: type II toxin-antitoxin system RelE/ParE family toxin [Flavobacteriales bacterium]
MAQIRFTAEAIRDIEEIHAYIAQDSARYADRQVQLFYAEAERLERTRTGGRMVPETADPSLRESIIGNYRMMFRLLEPDIIEILLIHHGKRRFPYGRVMSGTRR